METVEVLVGTWVVEAPRYVYYPNVAPGDKYDLKELSDDGYLKPLLALVHAVNNTQVIHLDGPILMFGADRWDIAEDDGPLASDDHHVLVKSEPETKFDEIVLDEWEHPTLDEEIDQSDGDGGAD